MFINNIPLILTVWFIPALFQTKISFFVIVPKNPPLNPLSRGPFTDALYWSEWFESVEPRINKGLSFKVVKPRDVVPEKLVVELAKLWFVVFVCKVVIFPAMNPVCACNVEYFPQ